MNKWNRIQDPEVNPYVYENLKYTMGKKKASSTNGVGLTRCQHIEGWKLILIYQVQVNQRTQRDILNMIEQKVGNSLEHIGTGDNFLNITPVADTEIYN